MTTCQIDLIGPELGTPYGNAIAGENSVYGFDVVGRGQVVRINSSTGEVDLHKPFAHMTGEYFNALGAVGDAVFVASSKGEIMRLDGASMQASLTDTMGCDDIPLYYYPGHVVGNAVVAVPYGPGQAVHVDVETGKARFFGPRTDGGYVGATAVVDEFVYVLPGEEESRCLRLTPATMEADWLGPECKGYVHAVAVEHYLYGIPGRTAERVLRLHLPTGEADFIGPDLGGRGFAKGLVAEKFIYMIPKLAPRVGRIDCKSGTVDCIGPDLGPENNKYFSAEIIDGVIYAVPGEAKKVLKIEPATGQVGLVGPEIVGSPGFAFFLQPTAVSKGALFAVPDESKRVLRISHQGGAAAALPPGPSGLAAQSEQPPDLTAQ